MRIGCLTLNETLKKEAKKNKSEHFLNTEKMQYAQAERAELSISQGRTGIRTMQNYFKIQFSNLTFH